MENQTISSQLKLPSAGELLKQAIEIYKSGFKKFIVLQFVPLFSIVPFIIILVSWGGLNIILKNSLNLSIANIISAALGFLALIFAIFLSLLSQIGILLFLKNFDKAKKIKELIVEARPFLINFISVSLLVGLVCFFGLILFIIPGIIWVVWFSFAIYVYIFEGIKGWSALKRSKELVKGHWWPVALRSLVIILISLLISLPMTFFSKDSAASNVYSSLSSIIKFLISPIFIIYPYLIYKNLVKIKNG